MLGNMNDNTSKTEDNKNTILRKPLTQVQVENYKTQSMDEFASELPDWDLLPQAMVIKRVRRGI